jgi:arylsulfatase A-like enzyme/Tfp pilus assembly protein PilF
VGKKSRKNGVSTPASHGRVAPSRGGRSRHLVGLAGALAVLAAAGAGWWWVRQRPPRTEAEARARLERRQPAPRDLNVVVLTLDTQRADRLGCYGYAGAATPNLDALAREGVLFEQATATVPITLPSHASIFTGLIPPRHGVHDNGGFFLEESKVTLARRLREAGWATGAFVAAWVLDSRWGLSQGFDTYADHFDLSQSKVESSGSVQKRGGEVMDEALAWLETVRAKKFFAWVHLYDPHTPYDPPEPYRSRYAGRLYDGEVAYTDAVVGRLITWLRGAGLYERTLIVVVGDHGESLGEHGESTHTFFIYDATTHVPLVVRTPWGDRGRSRAQVSTVDLMPTVLDLVGLAPQPDVDGRSLARVLLDPAADPGHVAYSETYFPRYHFGWQHLRALRDGKHKFIEAPRPELYDLARDPREATNVYKAFSRRGEELRRALDALAGSGAQTAPQKKELDPDTLQRLAALGYVGSSADVDPQAVLADPKDKIGLFNRMGAAKAKAANEKYDEAVAEMRAVTAEDPQIVDAYVFIGNWLRRLERYDEAVEAFRQGLAIKPDNELALGNLATLYRVLGRHEAALEGYRSVLKIEPRNPPTWYQLATLYLDLGRSREAEATFRKALEHNPKMGAAYNALGALAYGRGELAEAERLIRKGLELEPEVRTGRFNLARLLEGRGDVAGAERLYREELAVFADEGRARFNLAQLLRQRGDRAGYLAELRASTEHAPEFGPAYFFLAREQLGAGDLDAAERTARRGLEVDRHSEIAPLGHFVLADVLNRRGRPAEAEAEAAKGRALQAAAGRRSAPG